MTSNRGNSQARHFSTGGNSAIDYLTVPDHDLQLIPPQSPGSLSVPSSWNRNTAAEEWRRASSTASSIFDLSTEAEQLERALQENDILSLTKILKLHHTKFPVTINSDNFTERGSCDSYSQRISQGSQNYVERNDRRESVVTDISDVPAIFRTSLHVAVQNDSVDVLKILLKCGIDPNMPNQFCYSASRKNSIITETSYPVNKEDVETKFVASVKQDNKTSNYQAAASSTKLQVASLINESRQHQQSRNLCSTPAKHEILFEFSFNYSQDELFNLPVLYLAIVNANAPAVDLLLKYNANPNIQDRHGVTPLHLASCADFYNEKCIRHLMKHGAKIHMQTFFGVSACNIRPTLDKEQLDVIKEMMKLEISTKCQSKIYNMGVSQDSSTSSSGVSRFFKRLNSEKLKFKDRRVALTESFIESDLAERTSTSSYRSARSRQQSNRFSITDDTETDISMQSTSFHVAHFTQLAKMSNPVMDWYPVQVGIIHAIKQGNQLF
uniref:Uncharacterized protein n=1 Tax=Octopus bimaculoides TaxID=37653 RepID=A0A0L8FQK7_OCTBM